MVGTGVCESYFKLVPPARTFCCLNMYATYIYRLFVNACVEVLVHSHMYDGYICSAIEKDVYIPFYRPVNVMVRVVHFATE